MIDFENNRYDEKKLREIIRNNKLSNDDWVCISIFQDFSESFIRDFKDKVAWGCISAYQKLSEYFIREFKDSVYWGWISKHQILSEGFMMEFIEDIDIYWLNKNEKIDQEVKDRIIAYKEVVNL